MNLVNIPKAVFVDFDGTLVATRFKVGDKYRAGFSIPEWMKFTEEHGIHSYDESTVVEPVLAYVREIWRRGVDPIVLTIAYTTEERSAKVEFLKRPELMGMFRKGIFLNNVADKPLYICKYAKEHNISPSDCLIIEDTFSTMVDCMNHGIRVAHIANIIADNVAD